MAVLISFIVLVVATVPAVLACRHLASRLVAGTWERWAMTLFLVVLQIVLSMQLLGAVGGWRPVPYLVVALVGAGLVELIARRLRTDTAIDADAAPSEDAAAEAGADEAGSAPTGVPRWLAILAVAAPVFLVVAALASVLFASDAANDSTLYHRAMVAAWYRTNTIWRIGAFENGVYEGAFWSNGDTFGMWVVVPFARDYLLQLCSFVWAAGTFCALVAAARTLRLRTWPAVVVASAVLCSWGVVYGQLATFHVDLLTLQAAVVLIWTGLLWLRGDRRLRWMVLAGLAAGLAAGTKQAALPIAAILVVVLAVQAFRKHMWAHGTVLALCTLVPALIWPLRNLVLTGNPLWPFAFGPFPGAEPGYTTIDVNDSVLHLVAREGARGLFVVAVALAVAYGPLLVGIAFGGTSIWRWARTERLLAFLVVAPLVGAAVYLVTPITGFADIQVFITMRFLAPEVAALVLALGAAILAGTRAHSTRWHVLFAVAIGYGTLTVAVTHMVPSSFQWPVWAWPVAAVIASATGVMAANGTLARVEPRWAATGAVAAAAILVVVAVPLRARNWYPLHVGFEEVQPAAEWFEEHEPQGVNIAFAGIFSGWLSGRDLSNNVYFLGRPAENHGTTYWQDRTEWERALQDACTDYLVVGDNAAKWGRPLPEWEWAQESAILHSVDLPPRTARSDHDVRVYRVDRLPGAACTPPE
ncbi:MAG: hypothetical protein U0U69_03535 [Acidimicrobiia bacterium]